MWRTSKEIALGIKEIHPFDDHLYFLNEVLAKENTIYLAIQDGSDAVVGIMATNGEILNQLNIHTDFQRRGIGSRLLDLARNLSSGKLQLYTFEINLGAQAFYEKHGFKLRAAGAITKNNSQTFYMSGVMQDQLQHKKCITGPRVSLYSCYDSVKQKAY